MDSSSGVSEVCLLAQMLSWTTAFGKPRLTWIYSMEIVKVGSKAEPLNGTLNVLIDMGRRVRDGAGGGKDIESTLGCNWATWSAPPSSIDEGRCEYSPKTLSRTLCFLMKSPSSFSLAPVRYAT